MKSPNVSQTTSQVELPPELRAAAMRNMQMAQEVSRLGPVNYNGPSVAGFSPQQMASFKGNDQMASAFGMPSAINWQQGANGNFRRPEGMRGDEFMRALTGMAGPDSAAGGHRGYSFMPGYNDAVNRIPDAQRRAIESYRMDPHNGTSAFSTTAQVQSNRAGTPQLTRAAQIVQRVSQNNPRRAVNGYGGGTNGRGN